MKRSIRLAMACLVACVAAAGQAQAGVMFFTDHAAWQSAAGAASFTEDFSGFNADTLFQASAVALNGMSIQQEGSRTFRNLVEVPGFPFADNNGTNHASMFTDFGPAGGLNPTNVRITFNNLTAAFGFQTWEADDRNDGAEGAKVEIWNGAALLGGQELTNGAGDFLGFVLTGGDVATSVLFSSVTDCCDPNGGGISGEGFGLDNLESVNAAAAAPEPATLVLLGLGLAGLGLSRRRKA